MQIAYRSGYYDIIILLLVVGLKHYYKFVYCPITRPTAISITLNTWTTHTMHFYTT